MNEQHLDGVLADSLDLHNQPTDDLDPLTDLDLLDERHLDGVLVDSQDLPDQPTNDLDDWNFPPVDIFKTYLDDLTEADPGDLIVDNAPLVVHIAKQYHPIDGLQLGDLIGYGNIGLVKAAQKWDPEKGKFSSYAGRAIRNQIQNGITEGSRNLQIPQWLIEKQPKLNQAKTKLYEQLKRYPTVKELAQETGYPENQVVTLLTELSSGSLQSPAATDQDGSTLEAQDLIGQRSFPQPEENLERKTLRDRLWGAVRALTPKQQEVVVQRYGLTDNIPKTQKETAELLDIGEEAVRKRERVALGKLKHPKWELGELLV